MTSTSTHSHLDTIRQNIRSLEATHRLSRNSVHLIAVSKTRTADEIRDLANYGHLEFGENYVQEAIDKMTLLEDLALTWHFIGPIQKNKTKLIAQHFNWVQSIDREVVATRLNDQRPDALPKLNVCVQVNIDEESTKSGVAPEQAVELARHIDQLPNLQLRGLMAIPAITQKHIGQQNPFVRMHELFQQMRVNGFGLDTLSMGMSSDYAEAIAAGANMVRVGTAIFGPRNN